IRRPRNFQPVPPAIGSAARTMPSQACTLKPPSRTRTRTVSVTRTVSWTRTVSCLTACCRVSATTEANVIGAVAAPPTSFSFPRLGRQLEWGLGRRLGGRLGRLGLWDRRALKEQPFALPCQSLHYR